MPRINPLPGPSVDFSTITSTDFLNGRSYARNSMFEQLFDQINGQPHVVSRLTVRQDRAAPTMVTVRVEAPGSQPPTLLHGPRGEFLLHALMQNTTASRRFEQGNEMLCRFEYGMDRWIITDQIVTDPEAPTDTGDEMSRLRSQVTRLRDRLSTERAEHRETREALVRAHAERDTASSALSLARSETTLSLQLKRLHETSVVWRDARNGSRAKLEAFRSFCAVLDSLPVPEATASES